MSSATPTANDGFSTNLVANDGPIDPTEDPDVDEHDAPELDDATMLKDVSVDLEFATTARSADIICNGMTYQEVDGDGDKSRAVEVHHPSQAIRWTLTPYHQYPGLDRATPGTVKGMALTKRAAEDAAVLSNLLTAVQANRRLLVYAGRQCSTRTTPSEIPTPT